MGAAYFRQARRLDLLSGSPKTDLLPMTATSPASPKPKPKPKPEKGPLARWTRRCAWGLGSLCGAYILYWLLVAGAVWGFAASLMSREVSGNRLAVDAAAVSGFPFDFDMRFEGSELAARDLGLAWQPPEGDLKVSIPAYAPWSFNLDLSGSHRLVPLGQPDLASSIDVSQGYLRSRLSAGAIPNEVDLALGPVTGNLLDRLPVEAKRVSLHFLRPGARSTLDARADTLRLPPEITVTLAAALSKLPFIRGARPEQLAPALGSFLESASLTGYAEPALPAMPDEASVARWQAQGGVLTLEGLSAKLQRLELSGQGALRLNNDLQPRGRINLHLAGLTDFIESLSETGLLTSAQARFAVAMMARMDSGLSDDKGQPLLSLPIDLSDAGMSIGPVFLGPVPHVSW